MIQIQQPTGEKYAPLALGFRPFFLAAMAAAIALMLVWMAVYFSIWTPHGISYSLTQWHAHEMIFGYAMAVIAGFLLTAVKNWTGQQTLNGKPLLGLFLLWLAARVAPLFLPPELLVWVALLDLGCNVWLVYAVAAPIVRARQWTQLAVAGKVGFLTLANISFYLGVLGLWPTGTRLGLYIGFYLVLALVFTLGRRVIPFFIEKGVDESFEARNHLWLDRASLGLFLLFMIATINSPLSTVSGVLAALLFVLHGYRLVGWYTAGIWAKSLLWVLFIGYSWLVLGFLLHALAVFAGLSSFLAIHAFAVGGIGMITAGMMARVALGHTGNEVGNPPAVLKWLFILLALAATVRVVLPLLWPSSYSLWILLSQWLWIAAFAGLLLTYTPVLLKSRVDGMPG